MPKIKKSFPIIGGYVRIRDNNVHPDFQLPENIDLLVVDESARMIRVFADDVQEAFWHDKARFSPAFDLRKAA